MRRIFSVAIIALIALSLLAVLYIWQHQTMEAVIRDEGNGIFHEKKQETAVVSAAAAEVLGNPNPLDHGAHGETRGVSRSQWQDRLKDCVRAVKNLATSLGHRIHPHHRLAPPGVYFTLLYLSVPIPSGVTGLSAGTRVVCVKDQGPVLLVKMGNLEFEAKRQYLTNDLDVADLASRNDADAQQAVASYIAQQQVMDQARRDEENAAFDQAQQEIAARKAVAAAEASSYSNQLHRGAYGETTDVSGPPSVGQIILPQSANTKSANLAVPKPAPTP